MSALVAAGLVGAVVGGLCMLLMVRLGGSVRALAQSRRDAYTDVLTGLWNRRKLLEDLEDLLAAGPRAARVLVLLDLDGFKHYNDTFGHPAGDALLERLGRSFRAVVGPYGSAYRAGGDEFCALVDAGGDKGHRVVRMAAEALSERGEGFQIEASCGSVVLPAEATTAEQAIELVDKRLYAAKPHSRRGVAAEHARDALAQVLDGRPELREHVNEVARLSRAVAHQLGMAGEEVDVLVRAAELHDIGKIAVPEAILQKPGSLDEPEWEFLRKHTLVGERILSAAPALGPVAEVVRATHERYDGRGYPDGLAGDDIPLAARIIAVCDAYHAMTASRVYGKRVSTEQAIAELCRCGGGQFDPVVVAAFCRALGAQGVGAPSAEASPEGVRR